MDLTEQDYLVAATFLGCGVPTIKAVSEVESAGSGFLKDGSLRILFEGHCFYKFTNGKHAATHPALCHRKWTRENYCRGDAEARGACELQRLEVAKTLDAQAALMSCSVGRFQIMGFNFAACGYASVESFWAAMAESEGAQLHAFCRFVKQRKLDAALREQRWADFARGYNGPEYAKNRYDAKLAAAYLKFNT